MIYLTTFLVENLADAREYKVTEVHSNDEEISRLSVKDPLRNSSSDCTFHSSGMGLATTGRGGKMVDPENQVPSK